MRDRVGVLAALVLVSFVGLVMILWYDALTVFGLSPDVTALLLFSTLALGIFTFTRTGGKSSRYLLLIVLLLWGFFLLVAVIPSPFA